MKVPHSATQATQKDSASQASQNRTEPLNEKQTFEILTELCDRICPKGETPLDRGHAILEVAKFMIELFPTEKDGR